TASRDGTVKLWATQRHKDGYLWVGLDKPVFALAFSPDGARLAAGSGHPFKTWESGKLVIHDTARRQALFPLPGHSNGISRVAYSPDGKLLASATGRGEVKLWDLATRQELRRWRPALLMMVLGLAFSPDGESLAACLGSHEVFSLQGDIKVWDV